ncbi:MAG TPA: histidine phosphatase family protein [Acidimicrobiales bacterium]|jgi:broad specificity phosphatase PhoE|nr:histidine phosphatase family protein [Acidimicrobiales bacterium]
MLILVRHGETAANAARLLLGRADPPLTELGQRQAVAAGGGLGGAARLVSSPLIRARQTAEALGLSVPVEVDDRWAEIDYGAYDNRPLDQVPGELWRRWREDPAWRPAGGESLADVGRRVGAACEDLVGELAGSDVVVVSHVSPIKAAVAWALGVGDGVAWRLHLGLAAISRVDLRRGGPVLVSWNETTHLARLP